MPLSTDESLLKTANGLVEQLKSMFGTPPGFRPAHAKGILLSGTFTPSTKAGELSTAEHFNAPSTPILVRFSNSTGIPQIPDTDDNADPRGIGIRFNLSPSSDGKRRHTDIISHSTPTFPTHTGAEFLEFLQAAAQAAGGNPGPIGEFLGSHPKALVHIQWPKPAPVSYGTEQFWGVNAFKLINKEGKVTFVRWHIVPTAGVETLSKEELAKKDANYLQTEIAERLSKGKIGFKLLAQVAVEGDVTDDATVHWADSNPVVELGTLEVVKVLEGNAAEQKKIIFDPIPRVEGVEPSEDPLLEVRAASYLISGRQRREA